VEVACNRRWCVAVGARSAPIIRTVPSTGNVATIGFLPRLDLEGKYDPGGLYRVKIHPLEDAAFLIETEIALAVVTEFRVRWYRRHDDLTERVTAIEDGLITSYSDGGTLTHRLLDGSAVG